MIPSTLPLSPLRQRMLEDMRMRKLEPRKQEAYIPAVRRLAAFLKRSPDAATLEYLDGVEEIIKLHAPKRSVAIHRWRMS